MVRQKMLCRIPSSNINITLICLDVEMGVVQIKMYRMKKKKKKRPPTPAF
jgi:hypothetical protein